MLEIYVDADACPVKAEVEKVATRHSLQVHIVSNGGIRPRPHPLVHSVIVAEGADAADDWIVEHIRSGDIAITWDILLAGRCLEKSARVLRPNGDAFTPDNIGVAKGMREFQRHLREASGNQTYNAGFTQRDRSRFLGALENEIQALKRLRPPYRGER
ncbi:MAG TPA: YaiI/YqxD family protein [Rhizomicrobium sp.]|nr:YaiI/YqxD family protein [Rhizomicrobium sp.]